MPVVLGNNGILDFTLQRPDFRTATNIADAIDRALPGLMPDLAVAPAAPATITTGPTTSPIAPGATGTALVARPIDAGTVELAIPAGWMDRVASFISIVEGIQVNSDSVAKVVVSSSTGAVVLGGEVRLASIAIAY